MVELTENIVYRSAPRGEGLRYILAEVKSADAADTIVFSELTAIQDTLAIRLDTGALVACTEGTNIVTIPGGITDTPILVIVSGW